jgi:glycosyltransferase involved in cell wall biosynthesis
MKILLTVDPEIPVPPGLYGGIERIVEGLVEGYVKLGHDVTLCANPASKVPCKLIPWRGLKSQRGPDIIQNTLTLSRLVYSGGFDIIHSFSRLAYMTAVMPLRIPKIMSYQREPSLTQISKAIRLSRKNSIAFTGCSNYISDQIKTIAPTQSHTVYNFAPIERYTATTTVDADAPLVFLGRIEEIKGTGIAVRVAKKTNRRLIIAGNIPAGKEDYFQKEIEPFLDDRIQYIGPVNDQQKSDLLGQAAALLMTVQWNEPFGIVMAEAMACGTPVLGFPYGAIPEVVEHDLTGFVCSDEADMIRRVGGIAGLDRSKVRSEVEKRFSNTRILNDYLALYEKMIPK